MASRSHQTLAGATRVSAGARRWFRAIAMLAVPVLLLVLAEGVLRLAGFGYPTRFFLTKSIGQQQALVDNQHFGRRFFPRGLLR
jgi:hypothetical protein